MQVQAVGRIIMLLLLLLLHITILLRTLPLSRLHQAHTRRMSRDGVQLPKDKRLPETKVHGNREHKHLTEVAFHGWHLR
jgi:hypothetical protein